MSLKLPPPPGRYVPTTEAQRNQKIEAADAFNVKTNRRNILGAGASIVLQAPNGSYWQLQVSNTGVVTATSVTP
jgi:hypothetical protein